MCLLTLILALTSAVVQIRMNDDALDAREIEQNRQAQLGEAGGVVDCRGFRCCHL